MKPTVPIMTKCKQCNVTISDNTGICPLCRCVVDNPGDTLYSDRIYGRDESDAYPAIWLKERKLKYVCNIIFFAILAISITLLIFNYAFFNGWWWSVIPVAAMAYAYLVFRLIVISQKGYRCKVLLPLLFTVLLALIIDIETGFYRWSLNFVLPGSILLVDLVIIILMLTNLKSWHSYIIMQIGMVAASIVPLLLWLLDLINMPSLSIITIGVSALLFLGTVIIGDRAARSELRRRFHIR